MRGYVDASCGQIHYRHEGSAGPQVVLLHCANFSSNLYERALPILGQRVQAWAFDAPGVGLSDAPPEPTMTQLATWLLEALERLEIVRPVVGGLHTGARIVLQMAQIAGNDTFAGAVLSGVGPLSEEHRERHPFRARTLLIHPDTAGSQWMQAIERYREIYPDENPPTEEDGWLQHLFASRRCRRSFRCGCLGRASQRGVRVWSPCSDRFRCRSTCSIPPRTYSRQLTKTCRRGTRTLS